MKIHRKTYFNKSGITLTELIVSVIIMGVIMLGVVALDYAMRQSHRTSSGDAALSMRMAATMSHISNSAVLATGNRLDIGIDTSSSQTVFIRKGIGDPTTYGDDQWVVYNFDPTSQRLTFCPQANVTVGPPHTFPDPYCLDTSQEYLIILANDVIFNFVGDENTFNLYLEITITSRYDVTAAADPIKNRTMTSTTRIIPLQHTY